MSSAMNCNTNASSRLKDVSETQETEMCASEGIESSKEEPEETKTFTNPPEAVERGDITGEDDNGKSLGTLLLTQSLTKQEVQCSATNISKSDSFLGNGNLQKPNNKINEPFISSDASSRVDDNDLTTEDITASQKKIDFIREVHGNLGSPHIHTFDTVLLHGSNLKGTGPSQTVTEQSNSDIDKTAIPEAAEFGHEQHIMYIEYIKDSEHSVSDSQITGNEMPSSPVSASRVNSYAKQHSFKSSTPDSSPGTTTADKSEERINIKSKPLDETVPKETVEASTFDHATLLYFDSDLLLEGQVTRSDKEAMYSNTTLSHVTLAEGTNSTCGGNKIVTAVVGDRETDIRQDSHSGQRKEQMTEIKNAGAIQSDLSRDPVLTDMLTKASVTISKELTEEKLDKNVTLTPHKEIDHEEPELLNISDTGRCKPLSIEDHSLDESKNTSTVEEKCHSTIVNFCGQEGLASISQVSITNGRQVSEKNNGNVSDKIRSTSCDTEEERPLKDDSRCMDDISSSSAISINAKCNSTTTEQSEKTLSNCPVSTYITGPAGTIENSWTFFSRFQLPKTYDLDTVIAKLDATISGPNRVQDLPAVSAKNDSISCTETLPNSVDDELSHSEGNTTSNLDEHQGGTDTASILEDAVPESVAVTQQLTQGHETTTIDKSKKQVSGVENKPRGGHELNSDKTLCNNGYNLDNSDKISQGQGDNDVNRDKMSLGHGDNGISSDKISFANHNNQVSCGKVTLANGNNEASNFIISLDTGDDEGDNKLPLGIGDNDKIACYDELSPRCGSENKAFDASRQIMSEKALTNIGTKGDYPKNLPEVRIGVSQTCVVKDNQMVSSVERAATGASLSADSFLLEAKTREAYAHGSGSIKENNSCPPNFDDYYPTNPPKGQSHAFEIAQHTVKALHLSSAEPNTDPTVLDIADVSVGVGDSRSLPVTIPYISTEVVDEIHACTTVKKSEQEITLPALQYAAASFSVQPIDVKLLDPEAKTTPVFASIIGPSKKTLPLEVVVLDRKPKSLPIFAAVKILDNCLPSNEPSLKPSKTYNAHIDVSKPARAAANLDFHKLSMAQHTPTVAEPGSNTASASFLPAASNSYDNEQAIEVRVGTLNRLGDREHQGQCIFPLSSALPIECKFLNAETNNTTTFASTTGPSEDRIPTQVAVLERESKSLPIFVSAKVEDGSLPDPQGHGVIKGSLDKMESGDIIDSKLESLDRMEGGEMTRLDSINSSQASINSAESKRSALRSSQRAAIDGGPRQKQRVTFQLNQTESDRSSRLSDQRKLNTVLMRCHDIQDGGQVLETVHEVRGGHGGRSEERFLGAGDNTAESNEPEQCTEDDVDDDAGDGDDDRPHQHIDGSELIKLADETSLEIDMMEFVNLSNGSEANVSDIEKSMGKDVKGRTENEETLTEGAFRSISSDADETSLHRINSVESLPRDEDLAAGLVGSGNALDECEPSEAFKSACKESPTPWSVAYVRNGHDQKEKRKPAKHSKEDLGPHDGDLTNSGTMKRTFEDRYVNKTDISSDGQFEKTESADSQAQNHGMEGSIRLCINKKETCHKDIAENANSKIDESGPLKWGRTANDLNAYVEEFKSLSSATLVQESPKALHRGNSNVQKSCMITSENENTMVESSAIEFERTGTDNDVKLVESRKDTQNGEADSSDITITESATSIWGHSEGTGGTTKDGTMSFSSEQQGMATEDKVKSSHSASPQSCDVEIWVVPTSGKGSSNYDSMPSQVIFMENSIETSRETGLESSSRENTSRLEFSKSLSQISQFDASRLEKSIFSGPSVTPNVGIIKIQQNSISFGGKDSATDISRMSTGSGSLQMIGSGILVPRDRMNPTPEATGSTATEIQVTRVKFALSSISERSHGRSQSLPRSYRSSSPSSGRQVRSMSLSPRRVGLPISQLTRQREALRKHLTNTESSPLCFMKDVAITGITKDTDSMGSSISGTCISTSHRNGITPSKDYLDTVTTGDSTEQTETETCSYTKIVVDSKHSHSSTQEDVEDKKSTMTTIDSFHSQSEYAMESYNLCLEKHTDLDSDVSHSLDLSETIKDTHAENNKQQNKIMEEESATNFDISPFQSQGFSRSNSRQTLSSSSEVRFGHQVISTSNDIDHNWFVYRKQFGNLFMPSLSVECPTKPPAESPDQPNTQSIREIGTSEVENQRASDTPVYTSIGDKRKFVFDANEMPKQNLSTAQVSSSSNFRTPQCMPLAPEASLAQDENSLPKDDNTEWFAYRKHYGDLFPHSTLSAMDDVIRKCAESSGDTEHSETLVIKENVGLGLKTSETEQFIENVELRVQKIASHDMENASASPHQYSARQIHHREQQVLDTDVTTSLDIGGDKPTPNQMFELHRTRNLCIAHSENIKRKNFPVLDTGLQTHLGQGQSSTLDKPHSLHAAEKINLERRLNMQLAQNVLSNARRQDAESQKLKEENSDWFRYRKRWSNLFSEKEENGAWSGYKPYVINNTRYRLAMVKEDFDEPPKKADTSIRSRPLSYANHLPPAFEDGEGTQNSLGDASAMGDQFDRLHKRDKRRKDPALIPPRESYIGVALQAALPLCKLNVHPSQELINICCPEDTIDLCSKPPLSPKPTNRHRERSLPRVRHTRRSLNIAHSLSAHENAIDHRAVLPDQGSSKISFAVIPQNSISSFGQRLTPLPDIQAGLPLVKPVAGGPQPSESRTSPSSITFAEGPQSSASPEMSRPPNARRLKRRKREPRSPLSRENFSPKQRLPELKPIHEVRAAPPDVEAGEGDLLDEAVGGFEEGSLIDDDNLMFIKGVSSTVKREAPGKLQSALRHSTTTPGIDTSNKVGGGDDAGPPAEVVGGLLESALELTSITPATHLQVMRAQQKYDSSRAFLKATIPRKRSKHSKMRATNEDTKDTDGLIETPAPKERSSLSKVDSSARRLTQYMPVPIFGDSKTTIVEQSEDQKAQREIQKKQLQAALTEQKQNDARRAVSRTRSVGESSRKSDTDRITLKAHSRSEFKNGTSRHEHLSFKAHSGHDLGMSSQEASTETKAGGDKRQKVRLFKNHLKKKNAVDDSMRKLGATSKFSKGVTEARVESAVPESSPFPTGTLGIRKKIDRYKSCPRRVFAEGHYDHSSNIISVVVKPVNTKLDREQLNLKVQVHRKRPLNAMLEPQPPSVENPASDQLPRRLKLRHPPPKPLPVLASNIIDVRAINPPFNTTMSPEADRRFQSIFGHRKVL